MNKTKKIICIALSVIMVLSLLPITAFATNTEKFTVAPDNDILINGGLLKGLNPAGNTLAQVKALFINDAAKISAFRGETALSDSDLVGTGTVIKLTVESVVKDSVTAIIYGDVNGDGLVTDADYNLILDEALCHANSIEDGSVYEKAADVNNDTVIDAFDLSLIDLQKTNAKNIDQRGELPEAILNGVDLNTVGENGTVVIDGESVTFDTAFEFTATQNLDEIAYKEYRDWNVDIVISFNKNVDGSKVYLVGQYGPYNWLGARLSDSVIPAGTKVSVINDWLGEHLTYTDVIEYVQDFKSAMHVEDAEEMLKVTCELVMTDLETDDSYVVSTYEYIYAPPELPEIEISMLSNNPFDNTFSLQYGDVTVNADVAVQYATEEMPEDIVDKEYKDWNVDFLISFNREVDGNEVYIFSQYGSDDWTGGPLSDEIIAAGRKTALMEEWSGETISYSELVDLEEFNLAIDVVNPASGLVVTLQLVMINPTTGARYVIDTFTHLF